MTDKAVVNELNTFLRGEEMAIDAYERYIGTVGDEVVKREFETFLNDHKNHKDILSQRIKELGGEPQLGTGMAGTMAKAKFSIEKIGGINTLELLKEAYEGEDKGIAMAEEIVKGDLDEKSAQIIKAILEVDHAHLGRMAHIISDFQPG